MSQQETSTTYQRTHANQSYRFVQLSDPHLSQIEIQRPTQIFNKRVLGYLSWVKKRRRNHPRWVLNACIRKVKTLAPDHVVITGDMTHIGLPTEFDQVANWLNQQFSALDTTVIPGNHDLYVKENWNRTFAKWSPFMCSDSSVAKQLSFLPEFTGSVETCYPIVRLRGPIAFIGVSSIYPAEWGRATGKVHQQQIRYLEQLDSSPVLKDYVKVVLIHHPPLVDTMAARKSLLNADMFQDWLSSSDTRLVLHGHGHREYRKLITNNRGREIPVIGCASCSSAEYDNGREAAFYLFNIEVGANDIRMLQHTYQLSHSDQEFHEVEQKMLI